MDRSTRECKCIYIVIIITSPDRKGEHVMDSFGSAMYRMILGTLPIIDLPPGGPGEPLDSTRELQSSLRAFSPASELIDFGSERCGPNAPPALTNHPVNVARAVIERTGERRGMLLGQNERSPDQNTGGPCRLGPEHAGRLV
jgi:hypothetical protein